MITYYAAQLGITLSVVDECSVYQQIQNGVERERSN